MRLRVIGTIKIANQWIKNIPGKNSEGEDAPWCIIQKGTKKILSRHTTKEKAEAAFRAMELHKHGAFGKKADLLNSEKITSKEDLKNSFLEDFFDFYEEPEDDASFVKSKKYKSFCRKWKANILVTIDAMSDKAFPIIVADEHNRGISMGLTAWLETTDSWEMAEEGDYSGFEDCFNYLIRSLKELSDNAEGDADLLHGMGIKSKRAVATEYRFITDSGPGDHTVRDSKTNEVVTVLGRYGVWAVDSRGKANVIDQSDDLKKLMQEYSIPRDRVYDMDGNRI